MAAIYSLFMINKSGGLIYYKDSEPEIVDGPGTEAGHVISTTIGGRNSVAKQGISYIAEHVVRTCSFGTVFQAHVYQTSSGACAAYLANINTQDATVKFNGKTSITRMVCEHPS